MSENALYLLSNLTISQQKRLDDAGIIYHRETFTEQRGTFKTKLVTAFLGSRSSAPEGLVLDREAYTDARAVLGAVEVSVEMLPEHNIYRPVLRYSESKRPIVTVAAWREGGFPRKEPYVHIVQEVLLPTIRRDIEIRAPGTGEPEATSATERFQLHIWSSSDVRQKRRLVNQRYVFGQPVPAGSTAFVWSGRGTKITDGVGSGVGELHRKSDAYCFFDLTSTASASELLAFRRFCSELAIAYRMGDRDYRRRVNKMRSDNTAQRRSAYVELAENASTSSEAQLASKLDSAEAAARQAQLVYLAALERLDRAREEYDSLSRDKQTRRRRFEDEFDRFHHDPKFERVERQGNTVHVFTRTLYFATKDKKKVFRLGPVRIDILLEPAQMHSPIRIFNLDVLKSGDTNRRHHPHVGQGGIPCLGTSSHLFVELVRNREIYAAASYAVQYAEETNTSDSSQWDAQFPIVSASEIDALRQAYLLPAGV